MSKNLGTAHALSKIMRPVKNKLSGGKTEITPEDNRKHGTAGLKKARKALPGQGSKQIILRAARAIYIKAELRQYQKKHPEWPKDRCVSQLTMRWGSLSEIDKGRYIKQARQEQKSSLQVHSTGRSNTNKTKSTSPFGLYVKDHMDELKAKNPGVGTGALMAQLDKSFKELSQEAREEYAQNAAEVSGIPEKLSQSASSAAPSKVSNTPRRLPKHSSKRAAKLQPADSSRSAERKSPLPSAAINDNDDDDFVEKKTAQRKRKHESVGESTTLGADQAGAAEPKTAGDDSSTDDDKPIVIARKQKKSVRPTSAKGSKQKQITDMFARTTERTLIPKSEPLTAEQRARREKEIYKRKVKLMSKQEKEAEKKRIKEEKARQRKLEIERAREERKRQKEEEKRRKIEEREAKKPREDTELESVPLPLPSQIESNLSSGDFCDMLSLAEFMQAFAPAFSDVHTAQVKPQSLCAGDLEYLLLSRDFLKFNELIAALLTLATEVGVGQDSCNVPTVLRQTLMSLPVNGFTASEVLRLYLERSSFENTETLTALQVHELGSLDTSSIVEVLSFLQNKLFSNAHIMDLVEDAVEAVPKLKREIQEHERMERKQREQEEKEAASRGKNAKGQNPVNPEQSDAALAALLAEEEQSRVSRRTTRHREETPQERAAREALEENARKEQEREEAKQRYEEAKAELMTHQRRLNGGRLGLDRAWSQYACIDALPGFCVISYDQPVQVYNTLEDVDALIAALNERGIREKDLKQQLIDNRYEIERAVKGFSRRTEIPSDQIEKVDVDAEALNSVKMDIIAFYDKVREGGFGVPGKDAWSAEMEQACSAAAVAKCLLDIEEHIDLRFLYPPLGKKRQSLDEELTESERLVAWRAYAQNTSSASQVSLMYELLYESIRWDKSAKNVKCKICRKSTDEEQLLLCDGCDHGFHMFCLKPKLFEVPEGQWFCKTCKPPEVGQGRAAKRDALKMMMQQSRDEDDEIIEDDLLLDEEENDEDDDDDEDDEEDNEGESSESSDVNNDDDDDDDDDDEEDGDSDDSVQDDFLLEEVSLNSGIQRKDMQQCEEIVMLLRRDERAWPFLDPVDTTEVPDYLQIVTNPMDLGTIKSKLDNLEYVTLGDFVSDVRQVFENCKLYNRPDTEVGEAGIGMAKYLEELLRKRLGTKKKQR